jgi:uncharacterized protein (DUF302 family)
MGLPLRASKFGDAMAIDATEATSVAGLITIASPHTPKVTIDRLVKAIVDRGLIIVARVDHAGAAAKVGLDLRPTELLVFGNARAGTPLMQASQLIGIDLPLRALVWQDEAGQTWLSSVDPVSLAERHGILATTQMAVDQMSSVLRSIAVEATSP